MSYSKVMNEHYEDLERLSDLLRNYIEMYGLLINGTSELNSTSVTRKGELKHALERIDDIGDIIDDLLKVVKKSEGTYSKYSILKNEAISMKTEKESIINEINNELY